MGEAWVPVGWSWLGHRPEPLIHERLWASPVTGAGPCRALLDERGRGLVYRQPGGHEQRTTYAPDRIVVAGVVETVLEDGRPVRSTYPNGDEEHYHYEDERLVAIDEAPNLDMTASGAGGGGGGRLTLTYDDRGLQAIPGRWERLDEPWEEAFTRGVAQVAASIVEDVERVVRSTDPITVPIVSLTLVYVEGAGLADQVSLNPSRVADDFASGRGGWWPIDEVECSADPALEARLLSNAALRSIDDPVRTVLNAVAAVLARHDWSALFPVADDFVAFIAEHDEGITEKVESLRAANPPERAEPWVRLLLESEAF